ncbi:MAG: hypothetical protein JW722_01405 [Demequinaceae bacterium]|nr:hypothetical protein [Demequinaceae bacterium]
MYGWIWRHLPGAFWVKVLFASGLVMAAIAILFLWVFPWLAPLLPFQQQTVGG